ncbi:hypothetical protein MB901379_04690 [Mycobacterium basiliense]|uniref:DUF2330 domain-containing protein n=2 Tax=Mycobacterium basiliense TaxID=2094119 RepID=A0A447GKP7_9MYCO|nr:hypothetical protein MB901379_04690 [Mycobacterium basiliense]
MAGVAAPRSIGGMAVLGVCRLGLVIVLMATAAMATLLAAPGRACACGAAIAPGGVQATMNREVALAHWDGSTENIVMQLTMDTTTDNIALVVPTPNPAIVAAGDQATFLELDTLTEPQIRHQRRWNVGIGFGGAKQREATHAGRDPVVVNQVHLGPLEATTLAGGDLTGLRQWLADNGYAIRPEVAAALDPYVRDGWAFVAMRLTSTTPIVGGLSPVRLTFRSSQLVYPMRLSVAAQDPQHVVIFTLSDHRQQRIDADQTTQNTEVQFAGDVGNLVHDPLLRELAANRGSYLTKTAVDVYQTSRISSDFAFGNAPTDDAYRQTIVVYDHVTIPVVALLLAGLLLAIPVAGAVILLIVRHRGPGAVIGGPPRPG